MRFMAAIGIALSLACISAAEAPSNYQSFHAVRVDSDPVLLARYDRALHHCVPEASSPWRGSPDTYSVLYNLALRDCLYRQAFIDRGAYAYPTNNPFVNFLDR